MQQEIKVRELAEQFFKDEINKLDDPQRKEEVEHEEETYIGVWMLGFRAGEQHHGTSVWVKATTRLPETYGLITWRWIDKSAAYAGYDEKRGFVFGTGGARVDPTYYSEIEWYDESESPSKEGNKERELDEIINFSEWAATIAFFDDGTRLWELIGEGEAINGQFRFTTKEFIEVYKNQDNENS